MPVFTHSSCAGKILETGYVKRFMRLQVLPGLTLELLTFLIAAVSIMMLCAWDGYRPALEKLESKSLPDMDPLEKGLLTLATSNIGNGSAGQLPFGTPITASASGGNQTNTATLAGVAGKTTWISGFSVTATGATAALDVNVTLTGVTGGTMTFAYNFPIGASVQSYPLYICFSPPLPASGQNQAIAVSLPAGGAGNTNAAVVAWGMQE
jgi:hypothetical protein